MRESIDLPRLKKAALGVICPVCKGAVSQTDTRQNSVIWYCSSCEVYYETTPRGVSLRSFRKEANQIINLPRQEG